MIKKLLLFVLAATAAFAANVQIRDLATAITLASANTYLIADGSTQGTVKFLLASVPTVTSTRTTLAALSVTNISTGVSVQTLGGSSIGDGAGALYYYSSSSTATPNGTTIIQPAAGSGRWLIVLSNTLPAPTSSTLGGVFSKAGVSHQYLSALDTAGNFTLSTISTADVSGLGTMAAQNSSAVAITGGTIAGATITAGSIDNTPIGVSTKASGAFTVVSTNTTGASDSFLALNNSGGGGGGFSWNVRGDAATSELKFNGTSTWFKINYSTGLGTFTNLIASSNANLRTTKGNLNLVVNVKDYGALGDGVTNDTAAIASAKTAAVSAHGSLYFPPGTYITDLISVTSAAGLTIYGDGMGVSIIKARTPSQVLHVYTSTRVNVHHLTFDGSCTTRTGGQQAVIIDASGASFCDNEVINSGEFAVYFGADSAITDVIVSRNYIHACYADGINFAAVTKGVIANNIVDGTDDDCIALGYSGAGAASLINVIGNYCRARNDLGTTWGRGIMVLSVTDCQIIGNYVENTKQYGLIMDDGGAGRPTRIQVINNIFKDCAIYSGHAVAIFRTTDCQFSDNNIINPSVAGADCMELADWQNLTIQGGYFQQARNQFCRGIHADESAGWAASWNTLKISRVSINMSGASTNSCVYLSPDASVTMNSIVIDGVVGQQVVAGDYIFVASARAGTLAKIVNNTTATASRTVSPASSSGVFTVVNNN